MKNSSNLAFHFFFLFLLISMSSQAKPEMYEVDVTIGDVECFSIDVNYVRYNYKCEVSSNEEAKVFGISFLESLSSDELMRKGDAGETYLHLAAAIGNPEMIEFLLSNGLSLEDKDATGKTALHYFIVKNNGLWSFDSKGNKLNDWQERKSRGITFNQVLNYIVEKYEKSLNEYSYEGKNYIDYLAERMNKSIAKRGLFDRSIWSYGKDSFLNTLKIMTDKGAKVSPHAVKIILGSGYVWAQYDEMQELVSNNLQN